MNPIYIKVHLHIAPITFTTALYPSLPRIILVALLEQGSSNTLRRRGMSVELIKAASKPTRRSLVLTMSAWKIAIVLISGVEL